MSTTFVHLTDLHLSHPDLNDPNQHSDTVANLRLMVATLRDMTPRPDFIVASGDLTNNGDEASYRLVREMVEDVGIPVVYALGNHDNRAGFRRAFDMGDSDAPLCHQTVLGGLHVIALDSSRPGRVSGAIGEQQFGFLRQTLRENPDLAKLLVIHHPPRIDENALAWESLSGDDSDRLAATLRGHDIAGILCGHIHFNRVSLWHGIPVIVANGLHATVDILRASGMQIREGTGFGHCTWRSSGITVSFIPLTPAPTVLGEIPADRLESFR